MKNVNETNHCLMKMGKENHGNLCKMMKIGVICIITASSQLSTFGGKSLKMSEEVTYIYIYIRNFVLIILYCHTQKYFCGQNTLVAHLHKCVYICMYTPLPVCLLGRVAIELVSRSYMLISSLGKFYDCFSE